MIRSFADETTADLFRERFGAIRCPGLLGVDLGTPEGMAAARAQSLFSTRCAEYVRAAAEWAESIL